jgi:hypothetical protein
VSFKTLLSSAAAMFLAICATTADWDSLLPCISGIPNYHCISSCVTTMQAVYHTQHVPLGWSGRCAFDNVMVLLLLLLHHHARVTPRLEHLLLLHC